MFEWYRRSEVCYAYLEDVPSSDSVAQGVPGPAFAGSRWFRRGWTLQELLAPRHVRFFDGTWGEIGERKGLSPMLEEITGIEKEVLNGGPLASVSIGRRMSWASQRETTRVEDIAYSLLGIFDVNMPLIYGERDRAFIRLQEEIMKQSEDQSILAWQDTPASAVTSPVRSILATSPREFSNFSKKSADAIQGAEDPDRRRITTFYDYHGSRNPIALTSRGLRITAVVEDLQPRRPLHLIALGLSCAVDEDLSKVVAIYLKREGGDRYVRVRPAELTTCRSYGPQITIYGLRSWPLVRSGNAPESDSQTSSAEFGSLMLERDADFASRQRMFQNGFFVTDTTIGTSHGLYSVIATYLPKVADSSGLLEYRPVDPSSKRTPLILPTNWEPRYTYQMFKGAILLRERFGHDSILLVLGTAWDPAALEFVCWWDTVSLGERPAAPDLRTIIDKVKSVDRPIDTASGNTKRAPVGDGSHYLLITVRPGKVQGMDMFCIDIRGPWPSKDENDDRHRDRPV